MKLQSRKFFDHQNMGIIEYDDAIRLQKDFHKKRCDGNIRDTILSLQHPNIITVGKNTDDSGILVKKMRLKELGIKVFKTDRGGQITFHGPGQLVIYFIVDIRKLNFGPIDFVRKIEEVIISLLAEYEVSAHRVSKEIGVWVGGKEGQNYNPNLKKISALGLRISNGVSMHGLSLNIKPNLEMYNLIIPCGIKNMQSTSVLLESKTDINMNGVIEKILNIIEEKMYK